jgi:hypothetical protein
MAGRVNGIYGKLQLPMEDAAWIATAAGTREDAEAAYLLAQGRFFSAVGGSAYGGNAKGLSQLGACGTRPAALPMPRLLLS